MSSRPYVDSHKACDSLCRGALWTVLAQQGVFPGDDLGRRPITRSQGHACAYRPRQVLYWGWFRGEEGLGQGCVLSLRLMLHIVYGAVFTVSL